MTLNVKWGTCGENKHWCNLENLTLPLSGTPHGVYLIWHKGKPGRVVRVGQGNISDRLAKHRKDPEIVGYATRGTLMVTWAAVLSAQRGGVESYLADLWNPLIGDAFPDARPVEVNSPWS